MMTVHCRLTCCRAAWNTKRTEKLRAFVNEKVRKFYVTRIVSALGPLELLQYLPSKSKVPPKVEGLPYYIATQVPIESAKISIKLANKQKQLVHDRSFVGPNIKFLFIGSPV